MRGALVIAWIVGMLCSPVLAGGEPERVAASRDVVAEFGGELKGKLGEALGSGGPVQAIEVCNKMAPEISTRLSERTGWSVGRTALKVRNSANKADAWEGAVLEDFERRKASGEDPGKIEHHGVVVESGKKYFRYMRAIPMGAGCMACHGNKISASVIDTLDALYPGDEARGFDLGDIRGAFTVTQPMRGEDGM